MASETPPTDGSVQAVLPTGQDEEATESKPEESALPSSAVEKERSFCGKIHNAFAGFLFPRVTPILFRDFIILSIFAAIP